MRVPISVSAGPTTGPMAFYSSSRAPPSARQAEFEQKAMLDVLAPEDANDAVQLMPGRLAGEFE